MPRWKRRAGAVAADSALGDPWGVAINQSNLVVASLHAQGPRPAFEALRGVLSDAVALEDVELAIDVIETSAAVWAGLGEPTARGHATWQCAGAARGRRHSAGEAESDAAGPVRGAGPRFPALTDVAAGRRSWRLTDAGDAASEALGNMPVAGAHPG